MSTAMWRDVRDEAVARLRAAGVDDPVQEVRWIIEQASGRSAAEQVAALDAPVTDREAVAVERMVARRTSGEPLQHVLGRWGFRTLDLMVDARVLIPRPETEVVAGLAIEVLAERASIGHSGRPGGVSVASDTVIAVDPNPTAASAPVALEPASASGAIAVDLGTGSGAVALSIAAELWPRVEVWATDVSPDVLAVARANLAGLGRRAGVVRLVEGDWFEALPPDLRGRVDVVVSNPPYVAESGPLPEEVARWEPAAALFSGPTGLEAIELIVAEAPEWLAHDGVLVLEMGDTQGDAVTALARAAGFVDVAIHRDLAGRDRALVARR